MGPLGFRAQGFGTLSGFSGFQGLQGFWAFLGFAGFSGSSGFWDDHRLRNLGLSGILCCSFGLRVWVSGFLLHCFVPLAGLPHNGISPLGICLFLCIYIYIHTHDKRPKGICEIVLNPITLNPILNRNLSGL